MSNNEDIMDLATFGISMQAQLNNSSSLKRQAKNYGNSDRTKIWKNSPQNNATKITGQSLFSLWNMAQPQQTGSISKPQKAYVSNLIPQESLTKAIEEISVVNDSLKNKKKLNSYKINFENPYDCIRVLKELQNDFGLMDVSNNAAEKYIPAMKNCSVSSEMVFEIGELLKFEQLKHRKIERLIDLRFKCLAWLYSKRPAK